jgi:hypothetical protein
MTIPNREQEKKAEVLRYLHEHVFDPILTSTKASEKVKRGIQLTINRMESRDAAGIVQF